MVKPRGAMRHPCYPSLVVLVTQRLSRVLTIDLSQDFVPILLLEVVSGCL